MIVLVIGDFHIPDREKRIPFEIWQEIKYSKFDLILCTGDLTTPEILNKLKLLAPVKKVIGNMDYYFGLRDSPRVQVINLDEWDIGLIHGTGIRPRGNPEQLSEIAYELGVDILISGHVHALSIKLYNNILLLNPGSATGSWGGGFSNQIPSFLILEEIKDKLKITSVLLKAGRISHQFNLFDIKTRKLE
ncbi:MAG: YfcE family phosphodiesterase [Promethearchaeota archaeon]